MNHFRSNIKELADSGRFADSRRSFATYAGVDHSLLSRVIAGERAPTPEFVGRLCGSLPAADAAQLLKAFLDDIVAETQRTKPATSSPEEKNHRAKWRQPLSDIVVKLQCEPRRKAG